MPLQETRATAQVLQGAVYLCSALQSFALACVMLIG